MTSRGNFYDNVRAMLTAGVKHSSVKNISRISELRNFTEGYADAFQEFRTPNLMRLINRFVIKSLIEFIAYREL